MKKSLLSCLVFLSIAFSVNAQNPTSVIKFDNSSLYSSGFKKVTATSDGGYLALGNSGLLGWVFKLDANFNIVWSFGADSIPMQDFAETNDGNYVLLGLSYRTDYPNQPIFIVKTTPSGTVLFQKRYYDGTLVSALTAGGICKAAGTDQGFLFYGGNCIASQYAIKCDVNGVIQWEKNNLGIGAGFISTLIPDGTGYVGSFSYLWNSTGQPGIIRFDANGIVTNVKTFQTATSIQMYQSSLVKLSNGSFAVVSSCNDIYGVMIITVDAAFGTVTCNRISSVTQLYCDGNFATNNSSDEIVVCASFGNGSMCAIQVNPFTGVVSAIKNNGSTYGEVDDGLLMANGNYLLAGALSNDPTFAVVNPLIVGFCNSQTQSMTTQSNFAFTPGTPTITAYPINAATATVNYTLPSQTFTRTILCGSLTGETELEGASNEISMSPNPTVGELFIHSDNGNISEISVMDMTGRLVLHSETNNSKEYNVDLTSLVSGIYMVTVTTENGIKNSKIIRE